MADLWRIEMVVPADAVAAFEAALDDLCEAVLCFEIEEPGEARGHWRLQGLSVRAPDRCRLSVETALAARAAAVPEPTVTVAHLGPRDWVTENLRGFPPLDVGRFHIRGSHVTTPPPAGAYRLVIDAATAFGSGEHATTRGCLAALDDLGKNRRRRPRRALDMGCGSGVLALAAAAQWHCPVLAVDVDAEAARVARHNARRNGLARAVRVLRADGYRDHRVRAAGLYDLVLANILARPLAMMARPAAGTLAPGGRVVLSGLLAAQEARVLAAYARQGLRLERRYPVDEWMTLVLRGPTRERARVPGPGGPAGPR